MPTNKSVGDAVLSKPAESARPSALRGLRGISVAFVHHLAVAPSPPSEVSGGCFRIRRREIAESWPDYGRVLPTLVSAVRRAREVQERSASVRLLRRARVAPRVVRRCSFDGGRAERCVALPS